MPPLGGKTAVVTGANSGIGLVAARMLANKGARVFLACRDQTKAAAALDTIWAESPKAEVELLPLDLSSLKSIEHCAETVCDEVSKLDLLINNAGVMAIPYRKTEDGFEMQFGTNHLGHFALTMQLLTPLVKAPGARIVTVSSMAHRTGSIRFDDIHWEKSYSRWGAYGMSKLANLLFTFELNRRLKAAEVGAMAVACHPGYTATDLQLVGPRADNSAFRAWLSSLANKLFGQPADVGALPTVYAACEPSVEGGQYIGPKGLFELGGYPKRVDSNAKSKDEAVAAELWTLSESLTDTALSL